MFYLIFLFLFFIVGIVANLKVLKLSFGQSLSFKQRLWTMAGCLLYGVSPLLLTWIGLSLSQYLDCEAYRITFQCPTLPWSGDIVTNLVFAHWLSLISLPLALINIAVIALSLLAQRVR